jgi:hypothetical protein
MNFQTNCNVNLIIRSEELEWKIHGEIKESFHLSFKIKAFSRNWKKIGKIPENLRKYKKEEKS